MDFLELSTAHRVIICHSCQCALIASQLLNHFRKHHPQVTIQQRRALYQHFDPLSATSLEQVQMPAQPVPSIPGLPWSPEGLKCILCTDQSPYICLCRTAMKTHCRQVHKWTNPYSSGGSLRSRRDREYPWVKNVPYQRFFTWGRYRDYFEVILPTELSSTAPAPTEEVPSLAIIQVRLRAFDNTAEGEATVGRANPLEAHP